jgi:hypothetical protein
MPPADCSCSPPLTRAAWPCPLEFGAATPGDFFPRRPDIPASPVAPLLAGQELAGAWPLASLRPAVPPPGAWAPLLATRGRQGTPQPVVLAGTTAGRRWAVALGSGYWQWSFRGGTERNSTSGYGAPRRLARARARYRRPCHRCGRRSWRRPAGCHAVGRPGAERGFRSPSSSLRRTVPSSVDTVVTGSEATPPLTAVPPPGTRCMHRVPVRAHRPPARRGVDPASAVGVEVGPMTCEVS